MRRFCLTGLLLFVVCGALFAQRCPKGVLYDDTEYYRESRLISPFQGAGMSSSFSLKAYCPKPTTQFGYSTAVSMATTYYAATILLSKREKWQNTDTISRNSLSPAFNYRLSKPQDDNDCTASITLTSSLSNLLQFGSPPYLGDWDPCRNPKPSDSTGIAAYYRPGGYGRIFEMGLPQEEKIRIVKAFICSGNPVIISLASPPSLCNALDVWQPSEDYHAEFDGHALCVVGFDDGVYGGSFEVINSWGRAWGKNGFTAIRYSDFSNFVRCAFALYDEARWPEGFEVTVTPRLSTGGKMSAVRTSEGKYEFDRAYPSGTRFNISLQGNGQSGHVYLLARNNNGPIDVLFPGRSTVPYLTLSSSAIHLPGPGIFIELDANKGRDELIMLFSTRLLDQKRAIEIARSWSGARTITWNNSQPGFMLNNDSNEGIAVLSIFIQHI